VPQHGDALGNASAPVTLTVFEDPQCPFCRQWNIDTLPTVVENYVRTGRIKIVYRGVVVIGANSLVGLAAEYAARAGASAVVLYGTQLPAGGLGLDESVDVPVLSLPPRVGRLAAAAIRRHEHPAIAIGVPQIARNGSSGEIAPFSSRGLAFDGRVKPDLVAPGVVVDLGAWHERRWTPSVRHGRSSAAAPWWPGPRPFSPRRPRGRSARLLTGTAARPRCERPQGAGLLISGYLASEVTAVGHLRSAGPRAMAGSHPGRDDST
jgi:hypothetical protein